MQEILQASILLAVAQEQESMLLVFISTSTSWNLYKQVCTWSNTNSVLHFNLITFHFKANISSIALDISI